MKKKIIFIGIGIIIIAVALWSFLGRTEKGAKEGYKTEEIRKGELENLVSSTGTLSALETVEIGSQVSGILKELHVDFNSPVKKGQLLAVLDKTLFNVAVNDQEAGVSRARANLNMASAEVKRNEPLFKKGHISGTEFLVIKTDAEKAMADLKMAEAGLKRAKTNLEYCEIRSPIDGTVIERTIDEGQTIAASFQAPKLFVVARDLTRMQIEAKVDESDIGQIRKGQSARFTVQAFPERSFIGEVRQIRLQPETIQNVVNYTVIVDAPNNEGILLPGMTATLDFVIEDVKDVMIVPNAALTFSPTSEEMKKIFSRLQSEGKGQGNSSGRGSLKMPENTGRVFYMDKKNNILPAFFKKGVTDGIHTEVRNVLRGDLTEGVRVITGIEKIKKDSKENGSKNTILPSPPGRRR